MKLKPVLLIALFAFNFNAAQIFAQKELPLKVIKTFRIASDNWWDYIALNPVNNNLYVSHGTQVNILDKNTGDSVGIIPNTTGVHGIAFASAYGKGFTSNGRLNTSTVFDINSNKILDSIKTGDGPDAIMFEPFSKTIITCNGRGQNLSVIDPSNNAVLATIPVGGKPETAVSDDAGKVYVNIEDKSEIVVVNIKTYMVENRWSIAPGESPTGLAIDKKTRRLFAGCDNELLMVINADNGKIVAKLTIGEGCDGVGYSTITNNIFASNGESATLTVIHAQSADSYKVIGNIPTKAGARTCVVDENEERIFLPTAEFLPNPEPGKRPNLKPGTFQVLVVGKK